MDLLYYLESIRTPFFDQFFSIITYLGSSVLVVAVICVLYWCVNKELAYRIMFGFFLSGLLVQGLKIACRIPRPWVIDPAFNPVAAAVPAATGYSFPSGHTQSAAAVYGSLALFTKKRWLKIVSVILFLLVAFSRMYLGVHTPKDVFTAMGATLLIVVLVQGVTKLKFTNKLRIVTALLIAIISALLLTYSLTLYRHGIIEAHYAKDSISSAMAGIALAIGWLIETTKIQFSVHTITKFQQGLKFVIGLLIALLLKYFLGLLTNGIFIGDGIVNFAAVLWISAGYPAVIRKWFNNKICHV